MAPFHLSNRECKETFYFLVAATLHYAFKCFFNFNSCRLRDMHVVYLVKLKGGQFMDCGLQAMAPTLNIAIAGFLICLQ